MMYNQVKKTWAKQSVALDVRPATYSPFSNHLGRYDFFFYIYIDFYHVGANQLITA